MPPPSQSDAGENPPNSTEAENPKRRSRNIRWIRGKLSRWPLAGMIAAATWFLILAIGVLIPSEDYRRALGWMPEVKAQSDAQKELSDKIDELIKARSRSDETPGVASQGAPGTTRPVEERPPVPKAAQCAKCGGTADGATDECYQCRLNRRSFTAMVGPFLIASVSYLPLNICLLTLLAAFIGGCALNKGELRDLERRVAEHDNDGVRTPEADRDRKRLNYLREHPGYSALRGLIVFLIIVSGLLLAGGTSFILEGSQTEQLTQYFRLAGLFSFFGYLAGSDPTLFASMIDFGSARLRQPDPSASHGSIPNRSLDAATGAAAAAAAATAAAAQVTADSAEDTMAAIQAAAAAHDADADDENDPDEDKPTADDPKPGPPNPKKPPTKPR
jgi:hypothetical protein